MPKITTSDFRLRLSSGLGAFLLGLAWVGTAVADDPPLSGYFSQQLSWSKPVYRQANCALSYFHQTPDGHVKDYVLDEPLFRRTGEVRFLLAQESQCEYQGSAGLGICTRLRERGKPSPPSKKFEVVEDAASDTPVIRQFWTLKLAEDYIEAKKSGKPLPPHGQLHLQRCIGFSDEGLNRRQNDEAAVDDASMQLLYDWNAMKPERLADVLRVMEAIGKEALNATLPGQ